MIRAQFSATLLAPKEGVLGRLEIFPSTGSHVVYTSTNEQQKYSLASEVPELTATCVRVSFLIMSPFGNRAQVFRRI